MLSFLILFLAGAPAGADYKLEPLAEAPPAALAEGVREALQPKGLRLVDPKGKPLVDLWVRKELPAQKPPPEPQPGVKLEAIPEGTVLGAARYHQKHYDYKGKPFEPGVYTLRLGLQPRDGDHLGVSDTRDFALLCPAAADRSLGAMPTAEAVKLSNQVSGTKHPTVVWLKPVTTKEDAAPKDLPRLLHDEEKDLRILDLEIPAAPAGGKPAIRLGIVLVGSAPEA